MTEKQLKTITLVIDKRFVEMASNCIMGMACEKNFGDVFEHVATVQDEVQPSRFSSFQVATAVYQVLNLVFEGDEDAIRDIGQLLVDCVGHKTMSGKEFLDELKSP